MRALSSCRPLVVILLMAGCRPEPPSDLPAEPLAGFPVAQAGPDCAPWDGAAVTILFSAESVHPDSIRAPYLGVSLWQHLGRLTGRAWRWPAAEQIGAASWCLSDEDCRAATTGAVWLEPVGPDSIVAGRLRLEFVDQPALAGSFRAVWRPRLARCG
ncbi:MAG: hypothetical protein ACKVZ0_14025 [Gemmatimonadales bacterium]